MTDRNHDPNADLIGYEYENSAELTRWRVTRTWLLDSYVCIERVLDHPTQEAAERRIIGAAVIRNRKAAGF